MRNKLRIAGVAFIVAGALALAGSTQASAVDTDSRQASSRQALVDPNTVNSSSVVDDSLTHLDVKNGTLSESDMYAPFVASMRSVFNNGVDSSAKIAPGAVDYSDLNSALQAKVDAAGPVGPVGPVGPAGPAGPAGTDAILSVTADTMLTDRNDTATDNSVWAKDSMTRTLTVVRQHATEASKCGAGVTECWFYTGTIRDNGTFKTVAGAHGPNSLTPINGIVTGTVNGVYKIEFNASSDAPNPINVDPTVTGGTSTGNWMKLVFPAGTAFSALTGVDFKWDYISSLCENHTQATSGNTGDILGVNKCS